MRGDACDAYLLSESSLFVHDDRALLITCGAAPLLGAAAEVRAALAPGAIRTLVCDVEETGHSAVEMVMHDLDPAFCTLIVEACAAGAPARVRAALGFERLFPGFTVDEHAFRPAGYSLNAVRGAHHCAVHVSPHGDASYASLDTSWPDAGVQDLLDVIRPRRWRGEQQLY